jgi:peptidoglycan/xylan/chitin deacetylase (PgdA/CDA1 family)
MAKEFFVCLSHDVDRVAKTFQYATHFLKYLRAGDLRAALYQVRSIALKDHYWMFERVMEIEDKLGLRSTFFFLNETYPVDPIRLKSWRLGLGYYDLYDPAVQKVIRDLNNHGWEIGLHGSYLSYKDLDLLKKEKANLESIIGLPVQGIRQHYLNLDQNTWARQAEAGFVYDASFGMTDGVGFKEGRMHPFMPLPNQEFYVVPLAIMDGCIMRKRNPITEAMKVVKLASEKGACLVLNWHQERFNQKEFPGWMDLYVRLIEECKARGATFRTIGKFVSEWSGGTIVQECVHDRTAHLSK